MQDIFLIFGYGVPKDILKDENYNFYLKMVFNKIYDTVTVSKNEKHPLIICCGGKTDMFKPYKRTEADEMIRFFVELIKQKPFLDSITKNWNFVSENTSLSTLENLISSKEIIEKNKIQKANLFIFCEHIRGRRIEVVAKKFFDKNYSLQVIPIDFDGSSNRYLSPDFLAKKESEEIKHSMWVLQDSKNLKKHHEIFTERIQHLRSAKPEMREKAHRDWWKSKLVELKNNN